MFKLITTILVIFSLVGCTTLQVTQGAHVQEIQETIKIGDQIVLFTLKNVKYRLKVTDVTNQSITGIEGDRAFVFPYSQIKKIEKKESSPVKTTALSFGVVIAAVAVVIAALALYGFAHLGSANK